MKLLILTQYFPPEVGAPQNRLFELGIKLKQAGVNVTVLTAMPNYPKGEIFESYKNKKYIQEDLQGITVHRSKIYATQSKSIAKRLRNYFSFVFSSYFVGKSKLDKHYDFILCESPPLFLGITAYLLSKRKKADLIFNVSDLWPESAEKLGLVTNRFFLWMAYKLEAFLYKKSILVTCQTQGIVNSISSRFPQVSTYWLPNGVDLSFYNPDAVISNWRKENNFGDKDILLLYAGIIGHAQGLEVILYAAERLKHHANIHFIFLGSGPVKPELIELSEKLKLTNVRFLDVVDKKSMPLIIKAVDLALIPLKRLDIFKGAIPSKIFENLSMKKGLLLGVEGEAKELFIDEGNAGLAFIPEDDEDLANQILKLINNPELIHFYGNNGRNYVEKNFNRIDIASAFYSKLKNLKSNN
jgi:glycosyltransferase involved in cell wall biosynthesis